MRIVLTGVANIPHRARESERILADDEWNDDTIERAAAAVVVGCCTTERQPLQAATRGRTDPRRHRRPASPPRHPMNRLVASRILDEVGRRAERPLAIARAVAGVVLLVAPRAVASVWLSTRSTTGRRIVRTVAVRDLVVAAGQIAASPAHRAQWRRIAAVADLFDAAVAISVAVVRRRPATLALAVQAVSAAVLTALPDRKR